MFAQVMSGEAVRALQQELLSLGYGPEANGADDVFGYPEGCRPVRTSTCGPHRMYRWLYIYGIPRMALQEQREP